MGDKRGDENSYLHEQVEFWLRDRFRYCFSKGGPNDYRFRMHHRSGNSYRAQLIVYPRELVVQLFVFLTDCGYPAQKADFIRDLGHYLNEQVAFGSYLFAADDGSGALVFREAEHFVEPSGIYRMLHRCSFPISLFEAGFSAINLPKATEKSAAKLAKLLTDTDEGDGISSTLMGQLLQAERGAATVDRISTASLRLVHAEDERESTSLFDV